MQHKGRTPLILSLRAIRSVLSPVSPGQPRNPELGPTSTLLFPWRSLQPLRLKRVGLEAGRAVPPYLKYNCQWVDYRARQEEKGVCAGNKSSHSLSLMCNILRHVMYGPPFMLLSPSSNVQGVPLSFITIFYELNSALLIKQSTCTWPGAWFHWHTERCRRPSLSSGPYFLELRAEMCPTGLPLTKHHWGRGSLNPWKIQEGFLEDLRFQ